MFEYFRGWKRQLGVILLVTASVLLVAWGRSRTVVDIIGLKGTDGCTVLLSSHKGLSWNRVRIGPEISRIPRFWTRSWDPTTLRQTEFCGIRFEEGDLKQGSNVKSWLLPHWAIVVPLTLLSAYLLLTSPRRVEQRREGQHMTLAGH